MKLLIISQLHFHSIYLSFHMNHKRHIFLTVKQWFIQYHIHQVDIPASLHFSQGLHCWKIMHLSETQKFNLTAKGEIETAFWAQVFAPWPTKFNSKLTNYTKILH